MDRINQTNETVLNTTQVQQHTQVPDPCITINPTKQSRNQNQLLSQQSRVWSSHWELRWFSSGVMLCDLQGVETTEYFIAPDSRQMDMGWHAKPLDSKVTKKNLSPLLTYHTVHSSKDSAEADKLLSSVSWPSPLPLSALSEPDETNFV